MCILLVWLYMEVSRFLILLIPTPLVSPIFCLLLLYLLFFATASLLFVHFLNVFRLMFLFRYIFVKNYVIIFSRSINTYG